MLKVTSVMKWNLITTVLWVIFVVGNFCVNLERVFRINFCGSKLHGPTPYGFNMVDNEILCQQSLHSNLIVSYPVMYKRLPL